MPFTQVAPRTIDSLRKRATRDLAMGSITKGEWEEICSRLDRIDAITRQIKNRRRLNGNSEADS